VKLVEKAVCFTCGDRVLAKVDLPPDGSRDGATLTCPVCSSTWTPQRPARPAPVLDDPGRSYFAHAYVGDGYTLIAVGGDIDISTAVRFRDTALAALDDERHRVVVDLTDVTFMDSTGVAVLVLIRRKTGARDVALGVVSNPRIDTMLRVSGLDQAFEMYPDVTAALAGADDRS
jgi:anti-sigma B factor antagonist